MPKDNLTHIKYPGYIVNNYITVINFFDGALSGIYKM
jgi:hypothetical protein